MKFSLFKNPKAKTLWLKFFLVFLIILGGVFVLRERAFAGTSDNVHGWVWSDNVGWISFNCQEGGENKENVCNDATYLVWTILNLNQKPSAVFLFGGINNACEASLNNQAVNHFFSWDYSDPEDDPQYTYEFQVDLASGNFSNPPIKRSPSYAPTESEDITLSLGSDLAYNTDYKARVIVWDTNSSGGQGIQSEPSNVINFTTLINRYPKPDFTPKPAEALLGDKVSFTNKTQFYDGTPLSTAAVYQWSFGDGIVCPPLTNCGGDRVNPVHVYNKVGEYAVGLQATDSNGYSCTATGDVGRTVKVKPSLPEWKEVRPR